MCIKNYILKKNEIVVYPNNLFKLLIKLDIRPKGNKNV